MMKEGSKGRMLAWVESEDQSMMVTLESKQKLIIMSTSIVSMPKEHRRLSSQKRMS